MSKEMKIECGTFRMDSKGITYIAGGEVVPLVRYTEEGSVHFPRLTTRIKSVLKELNSDKTNERKG
ncbi:hypothetical protein CN544_28945 [Bacillus toyonensis]|uniref:hypothetical protein n=1 Tax=Bacillus toyonensis TaxID=155322 RepID=UPI000BF21F80|nr:hypothetical protein [Bacillus toyonensis]PEN76876.1 hypothetical protein CN544_28945 [Bacillus toyonensis]